MAKRGERKHMKRISAPKRILIKDKKKRGRRFLINTSPGPHKKDFSEPLAFLLREHLGIVKTLKEAKYVLSKGEVKVDGRVRKKPDFPVGLMDVISIGEKNYRMFIDDKGRLDVVPLEGEEAKLKPKKVINKVCRGKDLYQLTFHDGYTMLTKDNSIKVGDTLVFDVVEGKVKKHIPLKPGVTCLVVEGKHSGEKARLKEVIIRGGKKEALLEFKDKEVLTRWNYLFAVEE